MKYAILFFLCGPTFLVAQISGKITYEQIIKMEFRLPPDVPKEIRERVPKQARSVMELFFNDKESLYKNGQTERPEDAEINADGGRFRMRMRFANMQNDESYKNLAESIAVDKRDLLGKTFLVEDVIPEYKWKITGNKKQILSYLALEATTTIDDTIQVTAWFAPQIPVQNGPGNFGGLPGMILELDQNEGRNMIAATSVELGTIDDDSIQRPKKGKKVSREEFREISREKMKEMREQGGGAGRRRMVIRGN